MDNTTHRILAGIACEVGQLDGTIARLQEARDATERPEVRKEIHAQVLDELSRRNGLYRALRIAAATRTANTHMPATTTSYAKKSGRRKAMRACSWSRPIYHPKAQMI